MTDCLRGFGACRMPSADRAPGDALVMFQTLVLSALYNLSDDQIAYQVRDRLSFMRFPGPGLKNRVPDAKTVWLYRVALAQAGMVETLFRQFDGHLARQGDIARGGQILDAPLWRCRRTATPAMKTGHQGKRDARRLGKQARDARTEKRQCPLDEKMARAILATRTI